MLPVSLFLAPIAMLSAQTDVVIPRVAAGFDGNDIGQYPFGRAGFRTQIVIDSASFAPNGAVLQGIGFRPDNDNSGAQGAQTIPNVTIQLSQTGMAPATMSTTFANNVTDVPVTVFSGTVSLPAYVPSVNGVAPFATIAIAPFPVLVGQGNLLIDITAANNGSIINNWNPDTALPGGAVTLFGSAGQLSQPPDDVSIVVSGNGTQGRYSGIVPGGSMTYIVQSRYRSESGAFMLGFSRLPGGIDLAAIGAPGSWLYINPLFFMPYTTAVAPGGYRQMFPISFPADPTLVGGQMVSQAFVIDPITPAGIVTTAANAIRVGDSTHPVRQLNHSNYLNATGSFSYSGTILGGAVVQLSGIMN